MKYEIFFVAAMAALVLTGADLSPALAGTLENHDSSRRELRIKLLGEIVQEAPPSITVADLAGLPLVEYGVVDPYLGKRVVYKGVLLRELVKHYGKPQTNIISFRAVDDYHAEFTRDEWSKWDIMLAIQEDGKAMGLREKGPAKIVMPYDTAQDLNQTRYTPKWIWQINSIEFLKD